MTSHSGVVYEVSLSIAQDVIAEFDAWLAGHVEDMLTIPGFIRARTFTLEDGDDGRARRVTHYHIDAAADLDRYLAGEASAMRQAVTDRFGDRVSASRRVLYAEPAIGGEAHTVEQCLNCKTPLAGQYCASCGQRARSRLISLWELVRDAFGDLFELDSRLWRTLIPLIARPGALTRDYLEGRRARFMPPFRTYLVLSIIFFLVAFFDPKKDLQILFEPEEIGTAAVTESGTEAGGEAEQVAKDVLKELDEAGVVLSDEQRKKLENADGGLRIEFGEDGAEAGCDIDDLETAQIPQWLARRLTKERLQQVCDKVTANSGRDFVEKLLDNIPAALFFLLPLMALILKLLYPLSKRYYVEHLLFVLHFHAFFFLVLTLQILFTRASVLVSIPQGAATAAVVAISLYIPVYLYKAMRRVYGQGHLLTLLKYLMFVVSYAIGFSLVMLVATLTAAFAI